MQFKCDSGHLFHYPAKQILNQYSESQAIGNLFPALLIESNEFSVCPFCQSKTFTEYVEPVIVADALEDMQLVEFKDVAAYIVKGYVELDRKDHVYAKGLVMLKTKPKIEVAMAEAAEATKDFATQVTEAQEAFKETQP
jgi:hypothetical protein